MSCKNMIPGWWNWRQTQDLLIQLRRTWDFPGREELVPDQSCRGREWDQRMKTWTHWALLGESHSILANVSSTITGWENRIVSLLISWLIRSLHRNRRKLEFSFKKKTARSRQKLRLQSTSFKIQASSQMQPTNIQPPRNHLGHITKGDN